jgi:hypothetical protein
MIKQITKRFFQILFLISIIVLVLVTKNGWWCLMIVLIDFNFKNNKVDSK